MFAKQKSKSNLAIAFSIMRLIYVTAVRSIRKSNGNPIKGLLINIVQSLVMVGIFVLMFQLLGLKGAAIRGDFLLYIMSGIFMFMTFNKAMGAVAGSETNTSATMMHAPMNTIVAIGGAAIGTLYIQSLSVFCILGAYALVVGGVEIHDPVGAFSMLVLCWATGSALGLVVLAAKPWAPQTVGLLQTFFMRANMISSGKMFVANTLPGFMLALFSWNPLFHCIDQARGFAFKNYFPHNSSVEYPVTIGIICLAIGLLAEFFTRGRASASWGARD